MKATLNEKLIQTTQKAITKNKNTVKVADKVNFDIANYVKKTVAFSEQLGDKFVKKANK